MEGFIHKKNEVLIDREKKNNISYKELTGVARQSNVKILEN